MGYQETYIFHTYILSGCVFIAPLLAYDYMKKYNILRYNIDVVTMMLNKNNSGIEKY